MIAYTNEKGRNQGQIQELCCILDEALVNVAEFLDLSLKTSPHTETNLVSRENQYFFLLFQNVVTVIKSHFVFLNYFFTIWWSTFEWPFRRLLPLSCFYGSSQWLFKVKITFEIVTSIKKVKSDSAVYVSCHVCYPSFPLWSIISCWCSVNPLSANLTKWSDLLKQFGGKLPTNCLSVFDQFEGLVLKKGWSD